MSLQVITGSMMSGKTTVLIQKIREAQFLSDTKVLVFKPQIDNRYSDNEIVSHDDKKEDAIVVEHVGQMVSLVKASQIAFGKKVTVFMDEAQFFGKDLVSAVKQMLNLGVKVVVAGLNMDSNGDPFGAMPYMMAMAEHIWHMKTTCNMCGELRQSYVSYNPRKTTQIEIGTEGYQPVCLRCFYGQEESVGFGY